MTSMKKLLAKKGTTIWTIGSNATVFDALVKMAEKDIGSLMVMDDDKLSGLLTERGYARNIALKGKTSSRTSVKEIMERDVVCVESHQTVEECMVIMTEKRVRHLPVLEGGKVIGIVSIGDLVKETIREQKFAIEQLEHYVHG
jgi:CBS domain-containing protein